MPDDNDFDAGQPRDPWLETGTENEDDWPDEPSHEGVGPVALAATFLLGVVTSLVLVLTWSAFTGDAEQAATERSGFDGGTAPPATGPDIGSDSEDSTSPGRPFATRLARCARAARTLEGPLDAARPALDQWAVHVGAMNKLVVGEITLQQATDFWERTRVGADRRVEAFREAMSTLRRRGLDCPDADLLAPGARALPGCARQVEAEVGVLRAATRSIDTWAHHIHQMDMLRLGEITPDEATRAWLSMWQRGIRDLDAYRLAARRARYLDGCGQVGQVG